MKTMANEDRIAQEKQREEAERQRIEEAERQQRKEEKRQQEHLEREKRIAEEIEQENKSLEERLTKTSEKLRVKSHLRGRTNSQECSHIMQYTVEDDAEEIDIHEADQPHVEGPRDTLQLRRGCDTTPQVPEALGICTCRSGTRVAELTWPIVGKS
ncbi:hypothetical protein NDU88_000187 [Pleurodeles waltl]|uniref:Uncharacterized protein n=1 Tax=Pleurodeles waltl TaxID=8319 RepID=A0AAV7WI92_PLEWA|nr:hypothetical protein NDU88_000187 [Pleurodeles waltl]